MPMSFKSTSIYIIIIIFYLFITTADENIFGDEKFERKSHSDVESAIYKIRCTRRFSPGNCVEPVVTVWTFAFQDQNCSERLGCQLMLRSNRFPSYHTCMKYCQPLAELYLQMLIHNKQSIMDSSNYRKMVHDEATAIGKIDDVNLPSLTGNNYIQDIDANKAENIREIEAFYKDGNKYDEEFQEIFPPNIDYADTEAESTLEELLNGE